MSVTNVVQTRNQLTTNYDVSKFLLGNNSFIDANVTASGANVVLTEGLVMGRISATGLLAKLDKDATDGSQYPVGICVTDQTIVDGTTASVRLVNKGKVAESKVTIADGTLSTAIGVANHQRTLRDWIESIGIELMGGEELTAFDNY